MPVLPRVAFLPGAGGDGDFWSPVAGLLPSTWQTILLSWPGAGAVPAVPEVTGFRDLIELAGSAIPDGSDVVAQSMGGVVAVGLALALPAKVRRLVLVATSGGIDVAALGGSDWRREYRREFPNAAAWVTGDHLDYTPLMSAIEQPVCLIWGDSDPISPVAVGERLHAMLPVSALHVISGGGHALAREHPEKVAALVERHLLQSAPTRAEPAQLEPYRPEHSQRGSQG